MNGIEVLSSSAAAGNTGAAVQLAKRGVSTPEITALCRKHEANKFNAAREAWHKAPTYREIRYNPGWFEVDGKSITRRDNPDEFNRLAAEYDVAYAAWEKALARASTPAVARFILNGHYVHNTTKRVVLALLGAGYRVTAVECGNGKYIRLQDTYGEYRYIDTVTCDTVVNIPNGDEPYQSAEVSVLFGSSGSRNDWRVNGNTITVTCWH